jgi:AraC-like DNA-binding protein
VLSFVDLATRPSFAITAVTCRDDHANWSTEHPHDDVRVVLVHGGRFRRRVRGVDADLDPTVGYLGLPGEEERFAHPAGGDTCTSISLTPALWRAATGEAPGATRPAVYVDARLELAHRRLLAAIRTADVDFAGAERLVTLIAGIARQVIATPTPDGPPARPSDRALAATARELVRDHHPQASGLLPLADLLGVSPYRLSRAFTRELGVSLTRYRNRVRVGDALDRLAAGETRLGILAADLGFADQAHLSRTVRAHCGHTPTALRRQLTDHRHDTQPTPIHGPRVQDGVWPSRC